MFWDLVAPPCSVLFNHMNLWVFALLHLPLAAPFLFCYMRAFFERVAPVFVCCPLALAHVFSALSHVAQHWLFAFDCCRLLAFARHVFLIA